MNLYQVTDAQGGVNTIVADPAFVEQHYPLRWVLLPSAQPESPSMSLEQAQQQGVAAIKAEAAARINALDWKLQRAVEQEAAGWVSLAAADAVRAERESIRRSSDAAEARVLAMESVEDVLAFTWSVDVLVPVPRRLTHKAFADRFTELEFQSIVEATAANPAMRAWWEKFSLASDVNLDDPLTQAGLMALELAGVLAPGRTVEMLA